jgi:hypothetical protein
MAANTTTSKTGSTTSDVTTFLINGHQGAVQLLVAYTKGNGTSVALSPLEFLIPDLSTTVWYKVPAADGSGTTLGAFTLTLDATGNYVLTYSYVPMNATKMRVTATYTGGTTQALQMDCYPDFN